jgi:transposase
LKAYSQDLRDRVIGTHKEGLLNKFEISNMYKISYDAVCDWIKLFETTGDYSSKQGVGSGRKIKFNDTNLILKYLAENPDADGVEIREAVAPDISMSTFYNILKRLDITFKKKSLNTSKEMKLIGKSI